MQDDFTETGAKALVKTIKAYWAAKGYDVACKASEMRIPMRANSNQAEPLWCVRSDMVNGLPVRKLMKQAA